MALVVFVRGANVGGHRTFRPSLLAARLARHDVVSVGAAGTFVARKAIGVTQLRDELRRHLPFEAHVMICSGKELLRATAEDPFVDEKPRPDIVQFVSILQRQPRATPAIPIRLPADGRWCVRVLATQGRFVFGLYRREMKAIGYLDRLDEIFGAPATTRSWSTITTLRKLL